MARLIATAPVTCETLVSRSRFLGYLYPVESDTAARRQIGAVSSEHSDASHVVFAYVLGGDHEIFAFSDAGEPHGTAGKPILEILRYGDLINVLVCVVRYFGGTKLGTGGLVRAYGDVCKELIAKVPTRPFVEEKRFIIAVPYDLYESTRRLLESRCGIIESERFGVAVELSVALDTAAVAAVRQELLDLSRGEIDLADGADA